jgi:virulence factor Mce-like protein
MIADRISEGLTRERLGLELRRASRPFAVWLALVALGLASVAILLSYLHVPWPWQHQYAVRFALAADAKGVVPGSNDVRISGVHVGTITEVRLDHGRQVITAQIDPRYGVLYRNARARLRPATPLLDQYLDIVSRGTAAAGKVPDGGLIPAARTQTPVDFGRILDVFNADVRPRVAATIDVLGQGLQDHGAHLRRALVELVPFLQAARRLTHESAVRAVQTRRLVHDFTLLSAELARRDHALTRVVRGGDQTFGALASADRALAQTYEQLSPTLRALPRAFATLRAAADELDPTATALLPVADALPAGLHALERLSPPLERSLAGLDRSLPGLTRLMRATTPLGDSLADSFAALRPQAPRWDRVTAAIVPCETAVQKFLAWTMSLSKLNDATGLVSRGQTFFGSNLDAPGNGATTAKSCARGGLGR